jgi:zinc transport system substrate-binding protein
VISPGRQSLRLRWALAVVSGAGLLAGCSGGATAGPAGATKVVAAFYPLAYAAEQVGGTDVSVTSLTPPGVEPHDLELSASQVADIAQADVVLYVKGFQPAVDEAVAQQAVDHSIDVSAALPLIGSDPHVWLDPANMTVIGGEIADRLATLDPAKAARAQANAATLGTQMATLESDYADALKTCASRELVVSHEAFAYLAKAFGLTQVGISGLSPDAEPSPARMKDVADLVRAKGITTIYYETLVDPKVAQTVADETGASAAVLDPLEGLVAGASGDYSSIMRSNLTTLVAGQRCT